MLSKLWQQVGKIWRMDWCEKIACIKCDGDQNLLVCTENDCPLAIHKECMGCPARLDYAGHFYCPYCRYKKAVGELRLAREYALSRKKALLIFMDEGVTCDDKHLDESKRAEDNVCNVSDMNAETAMLIKCADGISRQNVDDVLGQSIHCDNKISGAEKEHIHTEEFEAFDAFNGQNPAAEMHEEDNVRDAEEKKLTKEEFETTTVAEAQDLSLKMHREQKINHTEGKMIQEKKRETNIASADHDSSVMVQEEDSLQEVYESLSASAGEEPSQTVPVRSNRGWKRSGSADQPSKTVKPKVKRSAVTPVRRSSRRLSSSQ